MNFFFDEEQSEKPIQNPIQTNSKIVNSPPKNLNLIDI